MFSVSVDFSFLLWDLQEDTVNGTVIANISAFDADIGPIDHSTLSFRLFDPSNTSLFTLKALDSNNVQLVTKAAAFDRALALNYILIVTARDTDGLSCNVTINIHTLEPEFFNFTVSNSGLLQGPVIQRGAQAFSQGMGFLLNRPASSQGQITATLGSRTEQASVSIDKQPIRKANGFLILDEVWPDQPSIYATAQLLTEFSTTYIVDGQAVLVASVPGTTAQTSGLPCTITSQSLGQCNRLSVNVPTAWFLPSLNYSTIRVSLVDPRGSWPSVALGNVKLHQQISTTLNLDTFTVEVPKRALYLDETFNVRLFARAASSVNTFDVNIQVNTTEVTFFKPPAQLRGTFSTFSCVSETLTSGNGYSLQCQSDQASGTVTTAPELLGVFTMQVKRTFTGTAFQISGVGSELGTFQSGIVASNKPIFYIDRRGFVSSSGTASVYVLPPPTVRGIFVSILQGELVNSAMLNPRLNTVSTTMSINTIARNSIFGRQNTVQPVTGGLACTSANTSIVGVTPLCNSVFLDGESQTEPGVATLFVNHLASGNIASLQVAVWVPALPLEVSLSDKSLSPVNGWLRMSDCTSLQYQQARISVQTYFRGPAGQRTTSMHILRLLNSNQLSVTDTSVASVSFGHLTGLSPGQANITIERFVQGVSEDIGSAPFEVLSNGINVTQLRVLVFTSVGLSVRNRQLNSASESTQISVDIKADFFREEQEGYVATSAVFEDGSITALSPTAGLRLQSTDNDTVRVLGNDRISVRSSGKGEFLKMYWQPLGCSNQGVLISGSGVLDVTLPEPNSVFVSPSQARLAVPGSPALSLAGLSESVRVNVTLVFARSTREMTLDSRTIYNTSRSNGVFSIVNQGGVVSIQAASKTGVGYLIVAFNHYQITKTIAITVVDASYLTLAISPYPSFPNSHLMDASQLDIVANTQVQQEGEVWASMRLTDGTSQDVSTHSDLVVSVSDGSDVAAASKSSTTSNRYILTPKAGEFGAVNLSAVFRSRVHDLGGLSVLVTNITQPIRQITNLGASARTGSVNLQTIHGTARRTVQFNAGVILADNTQYASVLSDPRFLGLINITSNAPSSVTVNPTSGLATLLTNHYTPVVFTASATFDGVTAIPSTVTYAANLDAEDGDIDLGNAFGVPVPQVASGGTVDIDLFVQTGSDRLGALDLTVIFDPTVLTYAGVASRQSSGIGFNFGNTPGVGRIGGAASNAPMGKVLLGRLQFSASSVNTVTDINVQIINLGIQGTKTNFAKYNVSVAGEVSVQIGSPSFSGRRRRSVLTADMLPASNAYPHHRQRRQTSGALGNGDADGDSVFNSFDVDFTQQYVADTNAQKPRPSVTAAQRVVMDANKDGFISGFDVFFMAGAFVELVSFVDNVTVQPVSYGQTGQCTLNIRVSMSTGIPTNLFRPDFTFVFVLVSNVDPNLVDMARTSQFLNGSFASAVNGGVFSSAARSRTYGGFLEAVPVIRRGDSSSQAVYEVNARTPISLSNIGLTVVLFSTDLGLRSDDRRRYVMVTDVRNTVFQFQPLTSVQLRSQRRTSAASTVFNIGAQGFNPSTFFDNTLRSDFCSWANKIYDIAVPENRTVNSTIIIIRASNPAFSAANEQYTIGRGNMDGSFAIYNPLVGDVDLAMQLDRETTSFYQFVVNVVQTSGAGTVWNSSAIVNVNVTDVNDNTPVFDEDDMLNVSLNEDIKIGSNILMLNVTDDDIGSNAAVTFSIVQGNVGGAFAVNSNTGELSVAAGLDRETLDSYSLVVEAVDGGSPALSSSATVHVSLIDVNDNSPVFSQEVYQTVIPENFPVNFSIPGVLLEITDNDLAAFGRIERVFVSDQAQDNKFRIVVHSKSIPVTAEVVLNGPLDRETQESYSFTVTAEDGGVPPRVTTAVVIINVTDINDNAPIFGQPSYTFQLEEDTPIGSSVGQVFATDADIGTNALLTYRIESIQPGPSPFSINSATGALTTSAGLSRALTTEYILIVNATDSGVFPLKNITTVTVLLLQPQLISFRMSGNGFVLGDKPTRHTANNYSQEIGYFLQGGQKQAATLQASYGSVLAQSPVLLNRVLRPAVSLKAFVLQDLVFYDSRSLSVAFKVQDDTFSSLCQPTDVVVQLTASTALNALDGTTRVLTCVTDMEHGYCIVQFSDLPRRWFDGSKVSVSVHKQFHEEFVHVREKGGGGREGDGERSEIKGDT